jgi:uncharacterized MnhB-related membrane protein
MKDFITNLIILILMIIPIVGISISLALIADGNKLGCAIALMISALSAVMVYCIFKKSKSNS